MKKISKFIIFSLFCITIFIGLVIFNNAEAQNPVTVYFFYGEGCPHCAKEEIFLDKIAGEYPQVKIERYETWYNYDNAQLMKQAAEKIGQEATAVPLTIIGQEGIVGYLSDETTGAQIKNAIDNCLQNQCYDVLATDQNAPDPNENVSESEKTNEESVIPKTINVPFLGTVNTASFSLPVFTAFLGFLDGFNPCAMWVLLFLITLLLGMPNRKRMWILGSAFIVSSGTVYFLYLAAWLNVLLFLGLIFWIRFVIGLVALGSGIYSLREYQRNKKGYCKVTGGSKRQKIFANLRKITQNKKIWLALGGIILLAAAVNLVELVCSAGLPVIFTQVLTLSNLPTWQYYFYLFLYIFFFMLDDMIVFVIAMLSLKSVSVNTKYARFSSLIGGIIMLIIGLILIFKPEILMFG